MSFAKWGSFWGGVGLLCAACGGGADPDTDGDEPDGVGGAGDGSGGTQGGPEEELVPLPEGSRTHGCIVNLVGAELAAGLDEYMTRDLEEASFDIPLGPLASTFYANYFDDYDFLVFVTPEQLNAEIGGMHSVVRERNIPGTGVKAVERSSQYGSSGRLRSAIGIDAQLSGEYPPFAHEVLHRWANHTDDALGFGDAFVGGKASHWGTSSVDGVLGGFPLDSLRCKTPQAAVPPNCTPESNGSYHYVVAPFSPVSSVETKAYAPLELYMMGLLPVADVPATHTILTDALPEPVSTASSGYVVEAGAIATVATSDIVATHGPRKLLGSNERAFTMAIVVITAEPATDAFLELVDGWAAAFGGRKETADWPSFATYTGGRATMNTCLGERRAVDSPLDEWVVDQSDCNPVAQDCTPGLSCYGLTGSACLPGGAAGLAEPCEGDADCAPGFGCTISPNGDGLCSPYCDAEAASGDNACATLCPDAWHPAAYTDDGSPSGAIAQCNGGAGGGVCDPLAQNCPGGLACVGYGELLCAEAGTAAEGAACFFPNDCVKGLTCLGFVGEDPACVRYCPLDDSAESCDLTCSYGFWDEGSFGVCYPAAP